MPSKYQLYDVGCYINQIKLSCPTSGISKNYAVIKTCPSSHKPPTKVISTLNTKSPSTTISSNARPSSPLARPENTTARPRNPNRRPLRDSICIAEAVVSVWATSPKIKIQSCSKIPEYQCKSILMQIQRFDEVE